MAEIGAAELNVLMELLESSESSDDEVLAVALEQRTPHPKPKIRNYICDVVHAYSDIEFKKNFRLNKETCYQLIHDFEQSIHYPKSKDHGGSEPLSAELHILSFLWYAGNKSCLRDVAGRFGIGESSFHRVLHRVMDFLLAIGPDIIKFPSTREEKERLAHEFQKVSGFPNVLGCIDGSYMPIRTPAHKIKSTYVNRHDMTSLTLQGICDEKRRFLDVFTGTSSKIHDARVLKLSFINEDIANICGNTWHLLGDAAYPLRPWLLTPFRDYGNLTNDQKNYNYTLSATRVLIENAFGLLKCRFRQLIRTDFHSVVTTSKFILSCCVLHNLCINAGDMWDDEAMENQGNDQPVIANNDNVRECALRQLGEVKRNEICERLQRGNSS